MKKVITLADLRSPVATPLSTKISCVLTSTGNLLVNYFGIFFFMTKRGDYLPWCLTQKFGKLINSNEYGRIKNLASGEKTLTASQEKHAKMYAEALSKDPLYFLTREQKANVELYREACLCGISVEELVQIKKVRAERKEKKERAAAKQKPAPLPTKKDRSGRTTFFLGNLPALTQLRERFSATGS